MTLTDDVLVPLTPLDAIMGHLGLTVVYVFPPPAQSAPPYDLGRVRTSLIATIEEDYPLFVGEPFTDPVTGACFIRQTPKTRAGGAQAIPFELDPHGKLTTDEAVRRPPASLLPARDHKSELIKIKATLLSDGGLALGYNSSHALLDGEGIFTFMNVWGMHYRGLPANERIVVNHDRHLVMPRGVGFTMPHPEFIQPQVTQPETPAGVEAKGGAAPLQFPETEAKPFHFSPEQLQNLKAKVSHGLTDGEYVSTIDVVTALFTVLITQARGHNKDVKITTGVNGRARFDPPLPPNYAGNCIFNALSSYTTEELSTPASVETIQRVALRIRASVLRRDEAFMRDAIEFIAQPTGRWVEMRAGVEFFFGADLMFTSWANMGMYKADFGAGTPVYAGPPSLLCDGMVIVMDAMNRATGLDVVPLLECKTMTKLTELWNACKLLHQ